jgi:hypothetical protein
MAEPLPQPDMNPSGEINALQTSELLPGASTGIGERIGQIASSVFVALEVGPGNEALRMGTATAAQVAFENSHVTAATLAASTFAVEGAGAVGAAYLLNSTFGERAINRINNAIERAKLDNFLRTNVVAEAAIGLLAGTPTAMAVKHRQDTNRGLWQNIRYGLVMTAGISAVNYPLGYAAAEGISHPSVETIGAGGVALGGLFGLAAYIRNKWKKRNNGLSDEQ